MLWGQRVGLAVLSGTLLSGALLAADPPATVLDLTQWKLTLPVDTDRPGRPDEIPPSALASFLDADCFFVNDAGDGVVFRAPCGGVTTRGSKYPRCELRELDGAGLAAWSTADDKRHTLTATLAVTATPRVKRHVVCAQIHDADDDVLMVRLEGTRLFVERPGEPDVMLAREYRLGTRFDLKIEAGRGRVQVWHDGVRKLDWQTLRRGCYFKAGCYTQSNPDRGDAPESYGEVTIHRLAVKRE